MSGGRMLQLEPGAVFANDFRIVSPLREGGMGAVYVVEQLSTRKRRALKLMLPNLVADTRLRQRFEQEAQVGASIESEHVVEVVAAGVDANTGAPWLAMELLEGEDLAERVARGPVPFDEVRRILEELCHAIGAAHAAGVVHRDLKPENVFLARAKRAGVQSIVKVLDFGIAKLAEEAKATTTAPIGSPMWMSPEQTARGATIGPPADVWAIGLIAFFLLTGRFFWRCADAEGGTLANLLREIVLDPIPAASTRARELDREGTLPPGFDAWLARALDRDPQRRFANAREAYSAFAGSEVPLAVAATMPDPARASGHPHPTGEMRGPLVAGRASSTTGGVADSADLARRRARMPLVVAPAGLLAIVLAVGGWTLLRRSRDAEPPPEASTMASPSIAPVLASASASPSVASADAAPELVIASAQPALPAAIPSAVPRSRAPSVAATVHPAAPSTVDAAVAPSASPIASALPAAPARAFDRYAARTSFAIVEPMVAQCRLPESPGVIPSIAASAKITFAPDGHVVHVDVAPPVGDTGLGDCVEAALRTVVVPPFDGEPAVVVKQFRFK